MSLRIFDLSNIIERGAYNKKAIISKGIVKTSKGYKALEMKSGGISLLFRMLKRYRSDTIVVCADRVPTIKRDMYPGYKMKESKTENYNRDNLNLRKQKDVAEKIIEAIGIPVISREGYEADDCIYSLVQQYKDREKIFIHSTDSDMSFLVDKNVNIDLVGDAGKQIDIYNYEYIVKSKVNVPYNTLTMEKIIHGDYNDNVTALPRSIQQKVMSSMYASDSLKQRCGDKQFVLAYFESLIPEALLQAKVIFPLDVEIYENIYTTPEPKMLDTWGFLVGCNDYTPIMEVDERSKELLEEIFEDEY